jgi:hypothetical protein
MPAVPAAGVDFMKSERAAWKNGPLVKHVMYLRNSYQTLNRLDQELGWELAYNKLLGAKNSLQSN